MPGNARSNQGALKSLRLDALNAIMAHTDSRVASVRHVVGAPRLTHWYSMMSAPDAGARCHDAGRYYSHKRDGG